MGALVGWGLAAIWISSPTAAQCAPWVVSIIQYSVSYEVWNVITMITTCSMPFVKALSPHCFQ